METTPITATPTSPIASTANEIAVQQDTGSVLSPRLTNACLVAAGTEPADPAATGIQIRAGYRDLNCKMSGEEWHRMVYRDAKWSYYSDERIPSRGIRASERKCITHGEVFHGELVCQHYIGKPVDAVYLIADQKEIWNSNSPKQIHSVEFVKQRDGNLRITLPDGKKVILPNPRK